MKRKERYIARLDEVKITREGDYAFIDYTTPGSKCEGLFAFRPRPDHRADSGHSKRSRSRLRQNDAEHLAKRARIEPWCVGMPSRRRAHFRPTDPEKVRVKYEDAAGIVNRNPEIDTEIDRILRERSERNLNPEAKHSLSRPF